jgi:hypothetical protein
MNPLPPLFKNIKQYDNFLSSEEFQESQHYLTRPMWALMNSADKDKDGQLSNAYWRMSLNEDQFFTEHVLNKISKRTKHILELIEVYANGSTTSMASSAHIDALEKDIYIFMIYMNPDWYMQWGGQTVFCNKTWDTENQRWNDGTAETLSVFPKPNSALYFPGNIVHLADAPSRFFLGLRTTIAYKVKRVR